MKHLAGLDSNSLEIFVRICELQSLTKAAAQLGLTQAAISQRIAKLEEKARVSLLDRSLRPITPTPAGQLLFLRAQGIIAALRNLELELGANAAMPVHEIRLGITGSLGTQLVPEMVPELRKMTDRLVLRVDSSGDLNRALMERSLDIVISNEPMSERHDLIQYEVLREPLILVCRKSEPIKGMEVYEAIEWLVNNRPFLRYSPGSPLARQIEAHIRQIAALPVDAMEFNTSETIVQMVKDGLGWTVTTPLNLAPLGVRGLVAHPLPRGHNWRMTWLLARSGELRDVPAQVAALVHRTMQQTVMPKVAAALPRLSPTIRLVEPQAQVNRFSAASSQGISKS